MRSWRVLPVLLAASSDPAAAFVLDSWTQETCAATSYLDDFEVTGCHTGANITGFVVTKSDASPGDAVVSVPGTDLNAGASLPATLDHNGVDAHAAADMVVVQSTQAAAASSAILTITLRNADPVPAALNFGFDIDSGFLQLTLKNFLADGDDIPIAEVRAEIWCESCVQKLAWSYRALYASYNNGNQFGVVNDLLDFFDPHGIGKPTWDSVDGGNICDPNPPYDCTHEAHGTLEPFQATIPIGTIDPGASATIRYTIEARSYTGTLSSLVTFPPADPPRASGVATLSDPFGVAEIVFVNGIPLSTFVPEPEPLGGAIAAFAALAIRARRRRLS